MHEHLFRGKTKETNEWIYGGYAVIDNRYFIIKEITYECGANSWGAFEVDPNTVGRFTGLVVRDGAKVFEDDVIMFGGEALIVYWNGETFQWQAKKIDSCDPPVRFPHEDWNYVDLGWIAAEPLCTGEMTTQVSHNIHDDAVHDVRDNETWEDVFF